MSEHQAPKSKRRRKLGDKHIHQPFSVHGSFSHPLLHLQYALCMDVNVSYFSASMPSQELSRHIIKSYQNGSVRQTPTEPHATHSSGVWPRRRLKKNYISSGKIGEIRNLIHLLFIYQKIKRAKHIFLFFHSDSCAKLKKTHFTYF